ncbi:siderophore-interacting protein [Pedobacter antarcticus]|uniref:siderophore-interacting protein n=1 Tax=Pedobacter antarcticus TaxID=34086 RepID=UPI00292CBAA4|nr:siderophore-interacting protein [Pedobacter antarcticus]
MSEEQSKPAVVRAELVLKAKKYINPHYIRVTLTGEDVPKFAEATVGVNNKIFIPPAGVEKVHFPEFDYEKGTWNHPPESVRPIVRTYTHRGIDLEKKEMIIDFVAHGDQGPASAWAINAQPGDKLGVAMKAKTSSLFPEADWYLLVADATGIPVIAAILEQLPATASGAVFIEVHGKAEEQDLKTAADMQINWVHHPNPGENTVLYDAVRELVLPGPETTHFGYVAAEYNTVRDIRHYLRKERGWILSELYAYAYWTYGITEDGSVQSRHQEQKS